MKDKNNGQINRCANCQSSTCSAKQQFSNESKSEFIERQQLMSRMCAVKHKILVLSGKGGVGKSTVAAHLAVELSKSKKVGLLDVDIHGPSIPVIFGYKGISVTSDGVSIMPVTPTENLKLMSIGFLLENQDDALIWRGPMKINVIKQFLKDVEWGELDYLIIDFPPGTGDEPLSIAQLVPNIDGAVIVTTPQELALADVRKCIDFCKKLNIRPLGIIENMSIFICPSCGEKTRIFREAGVKEMCKNVNIPFITEIPVQPEIMGTMDEGNILRRSNREVSQIFGKIIEILP